MRFFPQVKNRIDAAKKGDGYLQLSNCGFDDDDIVQLVALIIDIKTITKLDLSHNSIGSEGSKALASLRFITMLDLSYNNVDDNGALALCCALNIQELNLICNNIKDIATIARSSKSETLLLKNNAYITN